MSAEQEVTVAQVLSDDIVDDLGTVRFIARLTEEADALADEKFGAGRWERTGVRARLDRIPFTLETWFARDECRLSVKATYRMRGES